MGRKFKEISESHQQFIKEQKVFFVGTAAGAGRINISPKGLDSLRILNKNRVLWLNLTGSGNETAAHLLKNNRMTIMFCAFDGKPLILRLYGNAVIYHEYDKEYKSLIDMFEAGPGQRQLIVMDIDLVQTSCGFGVPLMDYKEDRTLLTHWAAEKGRDKIKDYWEEKNIKSIDGFETNIFKQ